MALRRLNFNMQEDLVQRIDEWAKKRCIARNAAIAIMCSSYLDSQSMIDSLPELLKMAQEMKTQENLLDAVKKADEK